MSDVNKTGTVLAKCFSQIAHTGLEQFLKKYEYGGDRKFWSMGFSSKDELLPVAKWIVDSVVLGNSKNKKLYESFSKNIKEIVIEYLRLVIKVRNTAPKDSSKEEIMEKATEELEEKISGLFP